MKNPNLTTTLFILKALCINVIGVTSVLSGVPLTLVILNMIAKGTILIIDAHRASSQK